MIVVTLSCNFDIRVILSNDGCEGVCVGWGVGGGGGRGVNQIDSAEIKIK